MSRWAVAGVAAGGSKAATVQTSDALGAASVSLGAVATAVLGAHPGSPWVARRARCDGGRLAEHGLAAARARLERLIATAPALPAAARVARHLATDQRAEQAIRPAVVTRKV